MPVRVLIVLWHPDVAGQDAGNCGWKPALTKIA
jgi:hypothetical protein